MATCRTCKHFHKDPKDSFLAYIGSGAGICTWKPPARNIPVSWFSSGIPDLDKPGVRYMKAQEGANCPVYEPRFNDRRVHSSKSP